MSDSTRCTLAAGLLTLFASSACGRSPDEEKALQSYDQRAGAPDELAQSQEALSACVGPHVVTSGCVTSPYGYISIMQNRCWPKIMSYVTWLSCRTATGEYGTHGAAYYCCNP
jgi:hypothetical protein